MKSIRVMSSWERADWLIRDPEGYLAHVKAEAATLAARRPRPRLSLDFDGPRPMPRLPDPFIQPRPGILRRLAALLRSTRPAD